MRSTFAFCFAFLKKRSSAEKDFFSFRRTLERVIRERMWNTAMLEQIVGNRALDVMQRGMEAANLRQEVISHNIANVNTPNFKKSNVVFEDLLAKELDLDAEGGLKVVRTHDRHMPIPFRGRALAKIELDQSSSMRYDKNNVDIDVEMASLAKNSLYFNALARQVGAGFSQMRSVITGQ